MLKRRDAALSDYDRAIALDAGFVHAHFNRGMLLSVLGQWQSALNSYDQAIAIKSDYAEAYCNRGNVLGQLGRWDAALENYDRAIVLKPGYAEACSNRGNALEKLERTEEALESYDRAIAVKPDYAVAYYNRGNALKALQRRDAAIASYERAVALNPGFAKAHFNKGVVLQDLRQFEAALESYNRAIEIDPEYTEVYNNRGNVHRELRRWDAALSDYNRAIELNAGYAEAYSNRAIAELLLGNFERGWEDYEWRWKHADTSTLATKRSFNEPRWSGDEPIEGKTILLHNEQGFGDTLQFSRYAKVLADLGARVILEVPKALANLLVDLDGVSQLVTRGSAFPEFDYQCPLLSLPLAFKTRLDTIPAPVKYLYPESAKAAKWLAQLGEKTTPRIGLAWSGSTATKSIILSDLIRYLPTSIRYVSLQKEYRDEDLGTLQANPAIADFSKDLNDFSDTAALCECMDLVISVDTSVAHLSGALGKPTWVVVMYSPDWRWLLDREDSPWYPTVRLFRQATIDDWAGALGRVADELIRMRRSASFR
jgi:tetratricopeptide (TPR) repeat protein